VESASMSGVKRMISELVERVAKGGGRIVLTSRGRPKAALVSIEDLHRLEAVDMGKQRDLKTDLGYLEQVTEIRNQILGETGALLPDSAETICRMRDERDEQILGLY
jgi:prevent-host-death family protein